MTREPVLSSRLLTNFPRPAEIGQDHELRVKVLWKALPCLLKKIPETFLDPLDARADLLCPFRADAG